jgi:hypothetical protein
MAVALRPIPQVKGKGAQKNKIKRLSIKKSAEWYRQSVSLWGLAATSVAVLALFVTWPRHDYDDSTLKRWNILEKKDMPCFTNLTSSLPLPESDCFHSADNEREGIPPLFFEWGRPHLAVYSTFAPPLLAPSLGDLDDQGRAISFIKKQPGFKSGSWADVRDTSNQWNPKAGDRDPFQFDRVLVAHVAKAIDSMPGDRILWTRILVEPINFSFSASSVPAAENETQKVASVERTDSRKVSTDFSVGIEGSKVSVGPSSEHTIKTSSDIITQYEKLGIDISPNFLRIMRRSETGDAVGDTKVGLPW